MRRRAVLTRAYDATEYFKKLTKSMEKEATSAIRIRSRVSSIAGMPAIYACRAIPLRGQEFALYCLVLPSNMMPDKRKQ